MNILAAILLTVGIIKLIIISKISVEQPEFDMFTESQFELAKGIIVIETILQIFCSFYIITTQSV